LRCYLFVFSSSTLFLPLYRPLAGFLCFSVQLVSFICTLFIKKMLAFAPALSLLFLLASQVSAFTFNVTFGTDNLAPDATFPDPTILNGPVLSTCASNCSAVNQTLASCDNNATCLCAESLVTLYVACEQCMYNAVIKANVPAPDDKAGSTPMLQAYSAACAAFDYTNITTAFVALHLAPNWDGPFGLGLNLVGTVFSVGAAFILAMSSLLLLSNLS